MVRVITIGREYGSGGGGIAKILAERLGWRLIDDPLVEEIARTTRASAEAIQAHEERVDPWFQRLVRELWRGGYVGAATRSESSAMDCDAIAQLWNDVIRQAGELGRCVIVGRGAQCLLQHRGDAFHVYVYAPMVERVERLRHREPPGIDLAAAARDRDRRRAEYIRHYFAQEWTNPHLYHLMVCSSPGLDRAAESILCAGQLQEGGR